MIAIIDYEAGNLTSVELAVRYLGFDCVVTQDPAAIAGAERVIFPGVGAAGSAVANCRRLGLSAALSDAVARGVPTLGICLGCQIILSRSEEDGGTDCLGLVPGSVVRFALPAECKIPHMGWNDVTFEPHPVFVGIEQGLDFYFVHSFYTVPDDDGMILGRTDYGGFTFASALGRGNLVATQFHPEKSGRFGLRLLDNFLHWSGKC